MSKAVMISIQPKWCELIASGKKTVEVRKTAPKEVPFKVYIYQTKESKRRFLDHRFNSFFAGKSHYKDMGKVIGEYICDEVKQIYAYSGVSVKFGEFDTAYNINIYETCLSSQELNDCLGEPIIIEETCNASICKYNRKALHISELKIYDEPRELSEFTKPCNWNYDCCTCKRAVYELTKAEARLFYGCDRELTRPPQSWCYVEEV